ncbi:MAG: NAD(+) synthetase, partial [Candidatus Aminicenantes bacterium]|nr:NAD(+) synthetase [Candidatus Aminicenantes bacterium]
MAEINFKITTDIIVRFISDSIRKNGFTNGIIGVSGGIDSAIVLDLTVKALGKDNTFALLMPFRTSSPESLSDGRFICDKLGVKYEIIDITPSIDPYFDKYPTENKTLIGNK